MIVSFLMEPDVDHALGEREQTDQSLRVERAGADQTLYAGFTNVDEIADAVICRARERADKILAAARVRADQRLTTPGLGDQPQGTISRERTVADETLQAERTVADEARQAERAEQVAALAKDRVETDKDLSYERSQFDATLATRDQALGVVAHELRNMLLTVVGFAELIDVPTEREGHGPNAVLYAQNICRAGARMNRLIGDLVDLARSEAGMLAVTPEPADPAQLVAEAIESLGPQAAARSVSVLSEIRTPMGFARFDFARITQVLANLLSNAIKFTPRDGQIIVRLESNGSDLCFSVSDTGIGIPPDKLEAIFDRFVQVARNDQRGVGLGLYISKCIVQGHGGRIWAESRLGHGSTFRMTLPGSVVPNT